MTRTYYHATPFSNLTPILENGIHLGIDGVVYLATKPDDAMKFLVLRGYTEILVCEVLIEDKFVEESFDHSYRFFQCRAFTYSKDIKPNEILRYLKYEIHNKKS